MAMRHWLLVGMALMASLATAQEAVDWSLLVEKVMPAVVTIVSADARDIVQGSGFIISSDGKIVTNFHVVAGKPTILARRSDGSFLVIKGILASDKANDLAILQAEGRNLPFVPLGDSDGVKVGEAVCVIGSPMLLEGTVSAGIISAVRELRDGRKLLQITAPISKGSSGSPIFNRKGEVIGVASFTLSEGQNLNFAVPSNAVKTLLRRLGIAFSPLPPSPTLSLEERFEQAYQEALQAIQEIEQEALRTAQGQRIEDALFNPFFRFLHFSALMSVAESLAEAGQFDRALQVAQQIGDAWNRSFALKDIAEAMVKAGQTGWANEAFQLALQAAQKIEDASDRSQALREIAEAIAKAGQFDLALQIAQKIEDALVRSLALKDIAEAMAEVGQTKRANQVFQFALQAAQKIGDASARSFALSVIAEAMAKAGQMEEADQTFRLAFQIAQKIKDPLARSFALKDIAEAIAKAGQFDLALQIAQKIEDAWSRSQALAEIVAALAKAGQLDRALRIGQKIEDAQARSWALSRIAVAMAKAGQLDRAVEVSEMIDDPVARLQALAAIMVAKRGGGGQEAAAK
jgi:serine protease Do